MAAGSLAFNGFAALVSAGIPLLEPLAGICMWFSSKYFRNNALNHFGALPPASGVYGLK